MFILGPNYDFGNYRVDMEHLYHHIDSAISPHQLSMERA